MEPIQSSLKKMINRPDFRRRFSELKQEVLGHPSVKEFVHRHEGQLSDQMIEKGLVKLYEFTEQSHACASCASINQCKNILKGYQPVLTLAGNHIDVTYEKCEKKLQNEEIKRAGELFQSMYIPKEVHRASISHLFHDEGRYQILQQAIQFVNRYKEGVFQKGLYLHGSFGTGKTYVLAAIANELAKMDIKTMLIFMPEFMREMKNSLQDQSVYKKVEAIKKVPVLMLDDIGAETMSSWFRDDILATILQYRMMEQLPLFFSSNLNFKELEHHLTYSQRGEVEGIKAARMMERIKYLTTPLEMKGKNYRNTE